MNYKRYLKKFENESEYNSQKDEIMGIPHVVLLVDTQGIIYTPEPKEVDYSTQYFTLHALGDGDMTLYKPSSYTTAPSYSVNGGDWTTFTSDTTLSLKSDDEIRIKCITNSYQRGTTRHMFNCTCDYEVYGNIMSLLYGDDFKGQSVLTTQYSLRALFYEQKKLKNAENLILPATTLAEYCYRSMFFDCTSLTTAPVLPATTLASNCYQHMFQGCASLTTAPELPATTLANYCYYQMFRDCTSLTTVPQLPSTTLANSCYYGMFLNCTSLTTAPSVLPATTLASYCYQYMFSNCTSLTAAPELPATTLASYCYYEMFSYCTSLTTAPELPATTLTNNCYYGMFDGCSKLNKITMLATNVDAMGCLSNWVNGVASSGTFVKNASMTSLPSGVSGIPNGWTVENTFNNISPCFINQDSKSITFVYSDGLFTPTNKLIDLSQYFTKEELLSVQPECEITVTLQDKFDNVLASDYVWANDMTLGDILNELNITKDVYDINVIITNVNAPEDGGYYYYMLDETEPFMEKDWMRIVSLEDDNTISLSKDIQYSINGDDWRKLYANNTITVNSDDIVYFKGTNIMNQFTVNKAFNVEGNIMSLLYGNSFEGEINLSGKNGAFSYLFYNCTTLQNAENLILPAITLAYECYYCMFSGCTNLTTAPELPAAMLAQSCYLSMFYNCTSLTTAPELPATTLASYCYTSMFQGCTNLTTAPKLPATKLTISCYASMFQGCSKLEHIEMLATDTYTNASGCLTNWVNGVASSGTFVKAKNTYLPTGASGIPSGWNVQNA